jgi:hypothetical protein
VTPCDFRQATNFEAVAEFGPPAAARAPELLPELELLDAVLELEPHAARMSAATTTTPARAANRDVRE